MTRNVRVVAPNNQLSQPTIVVPVVFDQGQAIIAESIPRIIGSHPIPRLLTEEWCVQQGLSAKPGSATTIRSFDGPNVVFVNVGATLTNLDHYRLAGAAAVQSASDGNLAYLLPTDGLDEPGAVTQALVEGALLASYRYRGRGDEAYLDIVPLGQPLPSVATHDSVTAGAKRGEIVANGVNWAKKLIDTPPGEMMPKVLARQMLARLKGDDAVTVESWTKSKITAESLGGLLGVSQGSNESPRLIYATYDPSPDTVLPHIALVGKGVTFDSGGLSLKSGEGMMTMKTDMTGAAVVVAALSIASRMNLAVKVTAIAPLTENLPSGTAIKPGDVLTIRNGMTIEVLNTDAEGRLILADGLSLAVEVNPDAIIDVATLTGAQKVALGNEIGALYTSTDELADYLLHASQRTGEALWRMPLHRDYQSHIESDFADVKNIGRPGQAGSISAALMLERFTDGRPWAHLDIAGPGRAESASGYVTKGATAFSTRTIVDFLTTVAEAES